MNKQFQTKLKCYTTFSLSLRQFYSVLFKNTIATLSTSQHPTQKEVNQGILYRMNVWDLGAELTKNENTDSALSISVIIWTCQSDTAKCLCSYRGKKNWDPGYSLSFITSTWSRGHLTAPVKTQVKCKCYCSFRMFSYLHSEQGKVLELLWEQKFKETKLLCHRQFHILMKSELHPFLLSLFLTFRF